MTRTKRGYVARKRRNNILRLTSGFRNAHSKLFRTANQQAIKSLRYAYRDRLRKKREFRKLWIIRINAIAHQNGLSYSKLMNKLYKSNILLNRKMLAQIAMLDSLTFTNILDSL